MTTIEYLALRPHREATWNDVALAFEAGKHNQESTPCHWRGDVDGVWETDCEQAFVLDSGTPAEHSMKFCGYCGHPLKEMLYQEDER